MSDTGTSCDCTLSVASSVAWIPGAEADVSLPATVWYVLGETGPGEVRIAEGDGPPPGSHRLALRLAVVESASVVRQLQCDTVFAVRPDDPAPGEEDAPYCGHEGNEEYEEDEEDEGRAPYGRDDPGHPGNSRGEASPRSSCDETTDDTDTTD